MSLKEFAGELNGSRVEGEIVKTILYSLLTSFVVLAVLYFLRFRDIDGFMANYGFFLFFAALSYAFIVPTVRQIRAYKEFACMTGMMVGMTVGMTSGFLSGFYVASTNGMFIGGFFGATVGMILGVWTGSCCGPMGFMEGIMAGFMGGLMGAMTAFMLFNDNLKIAAVLIFLVCATVLAGLNYTIYREMKAEERKRHEDHFWTILLTFILIIATAWLVVFGPRSAIFG